MESPPSSEKSWTKVDFPPWQCRRTTIPIFKASRNCARPFTRAAGQNPVYLGESMSFNHNSVLFALTDAPWNSR